MFNYIIPFLLAFISSMAVAGCATSSYSNYPSARETARVFQDPEIRNCGDWALSLTDELVKSGWAPLEPIGAPGIASFPHFKGHIEKRIIVISAAKWWKFADSVEYLGLCVGVEGTKLGYLLRDTVKIHTLPPLKPGETGA